MKTLADEVLRGAGEIAKFWRGRDTKQNRRAVYHAHEEGYIPTWKEGDQIVTTKSALVAHYAPPVKSGGAA